MRTVSQQLRTVDADTPIVRLHRLMLSLFGSGEEFRRWVALGPSGRELVAELPDGPGSTAAALLGGIEVLRRRGHLDAQFFARLADEFPQRAGDIETTARAWRMSARRQAIPTEEAAIDRRARQLVAAVTVAVGALGTGIWVGIWVVAEPSQPNRELVATTAAPQTAVPSLTVDPSPRVAAITVAPYRASPSRTNLHGSSGAPPSPRPLPSDVARACEASPELVAQLDAVADEVLTNPAITERFTILLRSHADRPEVSPRPLPGQSGRRRLYERLVRIDPAVFVGCRDVPIDVELTQQHTRISMRYL